MRGASRLRLTDVFASPNADSERHNPIESIHLEAVRIAIAYHLDRQRQLRSPISHIPTRLSTAQISGSALSSPAPAFSGLSVSLLRACARGHARCAGSWIESGLTASIGIRKEAAGCYVAPLPASNRPTIAGITPSKSSLGMKSYKVRFTWQQGEACAAAPISRTNCVDQSRCLAIRVR